MMSSIKSAEEAFKSETFTFLNVSGDFNDASFYPSQQASKPTQKYGKHAWSVSGGGAIENRWRMLGVQPDGPVLFSYAVVAGGPGDPIATPVGFAKMATFVQPNDHWYVIQAVGDRNDNNIFARVAATSLSNEAYIENDTE
jgi:hypothetical protein